MLTQSAKVFKQRWLEHQRERHAHPELFKLVSTGLCTLDDALSGGYELGQYVIIGGAQKSGKTTLLLKFMRAAAAQKKRFIFFGAEMTNLQIGSMLFSNMTGIERTKIRKIGLEIQDWTALERVGNEIETWSGYFNYGFSTLKDLNIVIKECEDQLGLPVEIIFGDYIQLMEAREVKGGRANEIEAISRGLKHLTIDRKAPMAAVFNAQLNRQSIRGGLVDANSFLGSGALERDMDLGLIIHEVKDEITGTRVKEHEKEIVIVGSRETGIGTIPVLYNGATATIEDKIEEQRPEVDYWST
jgi:replicative DNA helicase